MCAASAKQAKKIEKKFSDMLRESGVEVEAPDNTSQQFRVYLGQRKRRVMEFGGPGKCTYFEEVRAFFFVPHFIWRF